MTSKHLIVLYTIIIAIALFAYALPWVVTASAGLTMNAYDLAEWLSLHPEAQQNQLIASLLIRLQLVLIVWIIALMPVNHFSRYWYLKIIIIVTLTLAQFPPLEFIWNPSEPNQQQQFALTVASTLGAFIGLSGRLTRRYRHIIIAGISIAGIISTGIALPRSIELMQLYELEPIAGMGGVVLLGAYALCGIITLRRLIVHNS